MKKITFASAFAFGIMASLGASAATTAICDGSAAHDGVVPASGTAGTHYMITAIAPKCSTNVFLTGIDGTSGAWYAVGSASVKGKHSFRGHSNGGSVANSAACAIPGGCTVGEAGTARDAANTAAGAVAT